MDRVPLKLAFVLLPMLAACPLFPEPVALDCTVSSDCDGVAATRGQLCVEGQCAACDDDLDCVRVAHYGAGATCQAGRCEVPALPDAGDTTPDAGACRGNEGSYGCECYPNQTCNAGLQCVSGTCTGTPPGTEGGPCFANRTCNTSLVCDEGGICRMPAPDAGNPPDAGRADAGNPDSGRADAGLADAGMADAGQPDAGQPDAGTPDAGLSDAGDGDGGMTITCTGATGDRGCACFPNQTCLAGLACVNGACTGPETGTQDGPCFANRTCLAGLDCGLNDTCVPEAGSEGGACLAGLLCNTGLQCTNGTCAVAAAGQLGGACLLGAQCEPGLVCNTSAEPDVCRLPIACGLAGCAANQLCQPSTDSDDAVCLAQCRPGYNWADTTMTCVRSLVADCGTSGTGIGDDCAAIHETCVADDGPAHCGVCLPGFVRDQGTCRAVKTCAALACTQEDRLCVDASLASDAACGACRAGYAADSTGRCVSLAPATCDASLSAGTLRDLCSMESRGCLESPARCGSCVAGFAEDSVTGRCNALLPQDGVPSTLVFTTQPAAIIVAAPFSVAVEVRDSLGNRVAGSTQLVRLALFPVGVTGTPGVLGGTTQVNAVDGVATFAGLSIDQAGEGYVLVASSTGLSSAFSVGFDVGQAAPTPRLRFVVQPSNGVTGVALSPPIQVEALDATGARDTASTSAITLTLANNPTGATLGGATTVTAVAGLATFADITVSTAGAAYTLMARSANITVQDATSTAFTVSSPARLAFATQPSNAAPGAVITPAVRVELLDASGTRDTTATHPVTLSIGTNPAGGMLAGTATVNMVSGVATFANLAINAAGDGYTLEASTTAPGVATIASNTFNVTTAGQHVAFLQQPSNRPVNTAIPIQVELRNVGGTRISNATDMVTLAFANNPSGATLGGTLTVAAVGGVATFNNITVDQPGTGYTLRATATNFQSATSSAFSIGSTTPAGSRLVFAVQPQATVASTAFAVAVEVRDGNGNVVVDATDSITLALFTNPSSGALTGTRTVAAVAGRADFTDLSIARAGGGYSLVATASGIDLGFSVVFEIVPGEPAQFSFRQQPTSVVAGQPIVPDVAVDLLDAGGNFVSSGSNVVTLVVGSGASPTLLGVTSVAAVNGTAVFPGLSLERSGSHRLRATSPGMLDRDSSLFTVSATTAVTLAFQQQPTNAVATASISPAVAVVRRDTYGNTVTGSGYPITLAIGNNPGTSTLGGTTTVNTNSSGVSSFSVNLNKVGTGYTLVATGADVTSATSDPFSITSGPATSVAFLVQPSDVVAGAVITPAVQVRLLDAGGNLADTATDPVTMSRASGSGTLAGTLSVSAVAGVATFADLSFTGNGNAGAKTLRADGPGPNVTSDSFNVLHAAPDHVAWTTNTRDTVAGAVMSPSPVARVRDVFNNPCTSYVGDVSLSIATGPAGGTLLGATAATAVAGDATFTDVRLDKVGAYTLLASAGGTTATGTSSSFNISHAAAAKLGFVQQPTNVRSMATITPAVRVAVQDAYGNTAFSCCAEYDIRIATGASPAGTLLGPDVDRTSGKVATFSNLRVDNVGTYTLVASHATWGTATSSPFDVTAGGWAPSNNGMNAATTQAIAIDPVTPSIMYAGSMGGGVWKSMDGGATWTNASIGLRNRNVRSLGIDPVTPTTIYAGTNDNLYKSTDGGTSWVELPSSGTGCCDSRIRQVVVSPSNPQVVWVVKENNAINRSTDGGATWAYGGYGQCVMMVVDHTNEQIAYSINNNEVARTANGGNTWVAVNGSSGAGGALPVGGTTLVMDPTSPTTLYAGLYNRQGVYKTTNSGTSWTPVRTGLPGPFGTIFTNVSRLAMARSAPTTLYAFFSSNDAAINDTLWRTTDGGTSWTQATATGRLLPTMDTLVVHPTAPATLFAGFDGPGVYRSTDGGDSFAASNTGIQAARVYSVSVDPSDASILYAGTQGGGGFKSVNGGATWARMTALDPRVLAIEAAASDGNVLYAITPSLAFRSADRGDTWTQVHTVPTEHAFTSLAIDPTSANRCYLGHRRSNFPQAGNIAKTTDGVTFTAQAPNLGSPISAVTIDPQNPLSVWATSDHTNDVFYSGDGGATGFVGKGSGLGSLKRLVVHPTLSTTVYASGVVIQKTTNGNASPATWASASTGLPTGYSLRGLALDPTAPDTLYTGGINGEAGTNIYRTTDGGGAWTFAGSGLTRELILWVEHAPATANLAWAGTDGAGVFKTTTGGQ